MYVITDTVTAVACTSNCPGAEVYCFVNPCDANPCSYSQTCWLVSYESRYPFD